MKAVFFTKENLSKLFLAPPSVFEDLKIKRHILASKQMKIHKNYVKIIE
jgi:hypothetical protein